MSIHTFKNKIDNILSEALEANTTQISNGAAEDFPTYKYLVGVSQTLSDMKARIHDEYNKIIKSTGEEDE